MGRLIASLILEATANVAAAQVVRPANSIAELYTQLDACLG